MIAYLADENADYDAQQANQPADPIEVTPEVKNTYQGEVEEFSQAIIEKREPSNNAQLGLRNEKILSACPSAAARHGKVSALKTT